MSMVDIHIITLPTDSKEWLRECLRSLENEPVNIYMVDGTAGDIAAGRLKGFLQGDSEYVSFVDPDDLVIPGAFQKALYHMTDECCGVYTDEVIINESGETTGAGLSTGAGEWCMDDMVTHPAKVHHLVIGKRDVAERHLHRLDDSPLCEWVFHTAMVGHGPWVHAGFDGYKWRHHKNNYSARAGRTKDMYEAKAMCGKIAKELQK